MSIKTCAYRNCENYVIDGVFSGKFSMFSFPKNPERRAIWMKNAMVPADLPKPGLYMCSLHFEQKYISINSRRTLLIGPAEPIPYIEAAPHAMDEDVQDKEHLLDENIQVALDMHSETPASDVFNIIIKNNDGDDDDNLLVESTTRQSDEEQQQKPRFKKQHIPSKTLKRPADAVYIKQEARSPKIGRWQKDKTCAELDEAQLIDVKHVTTFIFKGEEYVQMPKDFYLQEKRQILSKLQKFSSILKNFSSILNELDDDD